MAGSRRWLEVHVRAAVPGDLRGLVADALVGAGARGVEERDGSFIAWFEEPEDPPGFVKSITVQLASDIGERGLRVEYGWQDHEEWAETWKRGLTSRRITDRIIVHPSWIEPEGVREGDIIVQVDPGMAFGTAEHGTTRGCLRLLDGLVSAGDALLDVGAGSGILAIAAAHLGASSVIAIEADSLACEAMRENLTGNGVDSVVQVVEAFATSEDLGSRGPVDGIVANIEAGLLEPLFDGCVRALHGTGWLIVSGILDHEWDGIEGRLLEFNFEKRKVDADGEWRSGLFALHTEEPHVVGVTA